MPFAKSELIQLTIQDLEAHPGPPGSPRKWERRERFVANLPVWDPDRASAALNRMQKLAGVLSYRRRVYESWGMLRNYQAALPEIVDRVKQLEPSAVTADVEQVIRDIVNNPPTEDIVRNAIIDVIRRRGDRRSRNVSLDSELIALNIEAIDDPEILRKAAEKIVEKLGDCGKIRVMQDLLKGIDAKEICASRGVTLYQVYASRAWLREYLLDLGATLKP